MKVSQIYENYMVPKNLQEHMLRVTGLAEIILEKWTGKEIDKGSVVQAGIFHDIAKPMNFDLAKQAQFGISGKDVLKLKILQESLKSKFGNEEHHATVKICEEIGLSTNAVKFADNLEWHFVPRLLQEKESASLLCIYCDMRVGPKGLLTIEQRHADLQTRAKVENYSERLNNCRVLEKYIQEKVSTDLNQISDNEVSMRMEKLLNLEI